MLLFGMKMMSEGLQKSSGDRLRKTLDFMTGNRFVGVVTGFTLTAIVQSSTAVSVMIVSFVNAGLLSFTQSIGVLFGINIGTTLTAWIISIVGFRISISSMALPAIGIGFILGIIKWKHRSVGEFLLGFGFLFLGLHFLTTGMRTANVNEIFDFHAIAALVDNRFLVILIGAGVGVVVTIIINSSTGSVALIMALAFEGVIPYLMAAGMIMGAQIGTTLNAVLVALNGSTDAKRTALVHVTFNIIGLAWALPLLLPLLGLVDMILPGNPWADVPFNEAIPLHIAGLHTMFNIINTIAFLPFVKQYTRLISFMIPDKKIPERGGPYRFEFISAGRTDSTELNILRAEKEISDMAGIVSSMYSRFCAALRDLSETEASETGASENESRVATLMEEMEKREQYVDEMLDALSAFFVECSNMKLSPHSSARIGKLLLVIRNLEEMSDECRSVSRLLEKSVRKNCVFKPKEMGKLIPYVEMVKEFLLLLEERLGRNPTEEQKIRAAELEDNIDITRKKLNKLGRKRIEAGGNVRTELLFIDLVRRIEKLGDYCFEISEAI